MNKLIRKNYINILKEITESDQKMRRDFRDGKIKWDKKIDKINSDKVKKIILEIGWPSARKIGAKGERYTWLIIQHSPDNNFQKECLSLMKKEHGRMKFIAFLEDRLRTSDNKKQLYGTQFYVGSHGDLEPRPIYDPKKLALRRKKVGLGSFEKYSKKIKKTFRKHSLYRKL